MTKTDDVLKRVRLALQGNGVTDRVLNAYQRLFSTDDGRIVLEDLAKRNYLFDTLSKGDETINELCIREGKRSVVLFILALMNVNLALYEQVLNRNLEE